MKTPAFQAYPKEWLSNEHIAVMTPAQEGVYWRLLCYEWLDDDCSLPSDVESLAKLGRISPEEWNRGGYDLVMARFKPHPSKQGRIINERLIQEREKQAIWRKKSATGGKKGAAKRWGKGGREENGGGYKMVTLPLLPNDNQTMALQFAVCSLHISTSPQPTAADIYEAYPRKVGRPKAIKAIETQLKKACPSCLLLKTQAFSKSRVGADPQFTPHPTTWFNQQRFNDAPETWTSNKPNPRNIGTATDETQQGLEIADAIRRRAERANATS
jgi:uncharacterized protein YdaU (DUF1376 family)